MNALLAGISGKLADRWVVAVVSPGVLLVTAVFMAVLLGQAHALDADRLSRWIDSVATSPAAHSAGALALAAVGALAVSAAVGMAAAGLGELMWRIALLPGDGGLTSRLRARRLRRWLDADGAVRRAGADAIRADRREVREAAAREAGALQAHPASAASAANAEQQEHRTAAEARAAAKAAVRRRDAICLAEPERPTWIADRIRVAGLRVFRTYGLDLDAAWPSLWSLASDAQRGDLEDAREACTAGMRLVGWAVLYLVVGVWWWPALAVAVAAGATGLVRTREAAGVWCVLAEDAADLLVLPLAERVGLKVDGPFTRETGERISVLLRKE